MCVQVTINDLRGLLQKWFVKLVTMPHPFRQDMEDNKTQDKTSQQSASPPAAAKSDPASPRTKQQARMLLRAQLQKGDPDPGSPRTKQHQTRDLAENPFATKRDPGTARTRTEHQSRKTLMMKEHDDLDAKIAEAEAAEAAMAGGDQGGGGGVDTQSKRSTQRSRQARAAALRLLHRPSIGDQSVSTSASTSREYND